MRSNGCDMLDVLDTYRCGDGACATCRLLAPIPASGTPAYRAWRRRVRRQILTDRNVLGHRPELMAWLREQEGGA